jgi:hypothetical protein
MLFSGSDVIDIGTTRVGQKYHFGARVPLDNPNWAGPWDCAEFTSWCAFQAYGLVFGAGNPGKISNAEPFSGFWFEEAKKAAEVIRWQDALKIPGAALIRAPARGRIGHVAFAMGDGDRTLEAHSAKLGVGIFKNAGTRSWSIGCLLPGVDYDAAPAIASPSWPPEDAISFPAEFLWLKTPSIKGPQVVALQRALFAKGIDPGLIDGDYGPMTDAAVISFQMMEGLEVDGVVGPETARALGLSFPIAPASQDSTAFETAQTPQSNTAISFPPLPDFDGIVDIRRNGKIFRAKTALGFSFIVGSATNFTDDMHRTGLFQGTTAIADSARFGVYKAGEFVGAFGKWAHFIEPTLSAEGGARFATLNTYDRAAFTFGAPQLAAHTPGENFIVYLRELLLLPNADKHFPELSLRSNGSHRKTVHLAKDGSFIDLEEVMEVTRPNGRKEKQLANLTIYLNSSALAVDEAELSAAARLMNWLRLDPRAKELQIRVFIEHAQKKLDRAKQNVTGFTGQDWRTSLWVMDILHQGRGTFREMSRAHQTGSPEAALKQIGLPKYRNRIRTVAAEIDRLVASGVMDGFTV